MKAIFWYSFPLFFLIFLSACSKTEEVLPVANCELLSLEQHPKAQQYESILQTFIARGVPGVSAAVISPEGTWAGAAGMADLSHAIHLTPCHNLRVGSVTKLFAAVTILKLQDEGLLDIDDPINQYIPRSITDQIRNANEVSIRKLLNHTSGIRDHLGARSYLDIFNGTEVRESAEQRLAAIYGKDAWFAPGTDIEYSNSNYLLLALVLKYAAGAASGYEVVQSRIIEPLALTNTYRGTEAPAQMSRGYYDHYDNGFMQDATETSNNAVGGADRLDGGIISSPYDLATFLRALFEGELLEPATLAEMQTFEALDLGEDLALLKGYGLGLMQIETPQGSVIGHYGGVHAFTSVLFHFPEAEVTLALILNGSAAAVTNPLYEEEFFTDFL